MLDHLNAVLFPKPVAPEEWDAAHIQETNKFTGSMRTSATILNTIGAIGAIVAGCIMAVSKFRGSMISSTLIFIEITSLALLALGYCLNRVVNRHYQGLSEDKRVEIGLEKLKEAFNALTVCQDDQDLQDRLENDAEFTISTGRDDVEEINKEICSLAHASYLPTKQVRARFDVSKGLTDDQKRDLLEIAHQKGIVLRFNDFQICVSDHLPMKAVKYLPYGSFVLESNKKSAQMMLDAFTCSLEFLVKYLPLDPSKIELINDQLMAFGIRIHGRSEDKVKTLNPTLYMEDEETVVIRGNCSEIGDPTGAIEMLAPLVKKIKIERVGLCFVDGLRLFHPNKWNDFQNQLNQRFPGKFLFIEEYPDMPDIWQADTGYELRDWSISGILEYVMEDGKRIQKIKEKQGEKIEENGDAPAQI